MFVLFLFLLFERIIFPDNYNDNSDKMFKKFPPVQLVTGKLDPLLDDSLLFASHLKRNNMPTILHLLEVYRYIDITFLSCDPLSHFFFLRDYHTVFLASIGFVVKQQVERRFIISSLLLSLLFLISFVIIFLIIIRLLLSI